MRRALLRLIAGIFILLHAPNGSPVVVNTDHIGRIGRAAPGSHADAKSTIWIDGEAQAVRETMHDIHALLPK